MQDRAKHLAPTVAKQTRGYLVKTEVFNAQPTRWTTPAVNYDTESWQQGTDRQNTIIEDVCNMVQAKNNDPPID